MSESGPAGVPGIVKVAVVLTFFNTWVLFEETVVDRYGLWEYMPYYRVGRVCSWDIGALALIVWGTFWIFRRQRRSRVAAQHQIS
jgi:cytochrome c-type biogenesis protein CcmH/NrfF